MKLSIITINYNNAEGLRKTLASVAAQTYADIEHIIVDGGSTDGSVEIIREYADNQVIGEEHPMMQASSGTPPRLEVKGEENSIADINASTPYNLHHTPSAHVVRWISEPDKGIYNAMNKGIRMATGEYIEILNSGDILFDSQVTQRMIEHLDQINAERKESLGILYGNMIKEYPDGRRVKDTCGSADYTPESFLYFYNGTLNHDCAYIRRDLFVKYGLYNEQMKICSDWEWYVRAIVLGGEKTVYTNIDVTIFDMTGISESGGKNKELILKERREYLESILPAAVLRDYDKYAFPISQYQRLKKYHLWGIVYFVERVLFKFEKWFKK